MLDAAGRAPALFMKQHGVDQVVFKQGAVQDLLIGEQAWSVAPAERAIPALGRSVHGASFDHCRAPVTRLLLAALSLLVVVAWGWKRADSKHSALAREPSPKQRMPSPSRDRSSDTSTSKHRMVLAVFGVLRLRDFNTG
jgi:hypothetical protein